MRTPCTAIEKSTNVCLMFRLRVRTIRMQVSGDFELVINDCYKTDNILYNIIITGNKYAVSKTWVALIRNCMFIFSIIGRSRQIFLVEW